MLEKGKIMHPSICDGIEAFIVVGVWSLFLEVQIFSL